MWLDSRLNPKPYCGGSLRVSNTLSPSGIPLHAGGKRRYKKKALLWSMIGKGIMVWAAVRSYDARWFLPPSEVPTKLEVFCKLVVYMGVFESRGS